MFRGPANLVRTNPLMLRAVASGAGFLLLIVVVVVVVPGIWKHTVAVVAALAMLAVYPRMLSRASKPKLVPVELVADHTGLYADNALLARREDITSAYIRPAFDEQEHRYRAYGSIGYYRFRVTTPALPVTLEMTLRRSGQLNIDPGGEGHAAAILTALGLPVTTCAPGYRPRTRSSTWALTAVMLALFIAAFIGYYLYMAHHTVHR